MAPLSSTLCARRERELSSILKHLKFVVLGIMMSLVAAYISLELLPKAFTVLPSYQALLAILLSSFFGLGLAFYITYINRGGS